MSAAEGGRPAALITGASSGIGLEFARLLAREGYDLIIAARRLDRLEELAEGLREQRGCQVVTIQSDLSLPGAASELYQRVRERELVPTLLVNNAGFGELAPFEEMDPERVTGMIELNCTSLATLCRLFLPQIIAHGGGRILNVSSVAAFQPGPFMAVYYATKAFVQSFSEALSEELSGRGVTVTALCPGPTRSEFQQEAHMDTAKYFARGKIPTAREVAQIGYRGMLRGRRVVVHPFKYRLLLSVSKFLPRTVVTRAVRSLQESRA